jgi:hypothetical protein
MAMNRKDIEDYFKLLLNVLTKNNLLDKPGHIYNMGESGFQMNPRPCTVIGAEGSLMLYQMTSDGKGETESVIACCNAEGSFMPPTCILKGKNKSQNGKIVFPMGQNLL